MDHEIRSEMGKGTKCSGIATGACASFLSQRGPEECYPVIGWIATQWGLFTIPYPGNVFQMFRSIHMYKCNIQYTDVYFIYSLNIYILLYNNKSIA